MIYLRTILLFAFCIISVGCFDFVEPTIPALEETPPEFHVFASVEPDGRLIVNAMFTPGITAQGAQRHVLNDTLHVLGKPVSSETILQYGERIFRVDTTFDGIVPPLTIEAPAVAGYAQLPPLHLATPYKLAGDTIRTARNQDVVLRVAGLPTTSDSTQVHRWGLLMSGPQSSIQITGSGILPHDLVVPASWLQQLTDTVLSLSVIVDQFGRPSVNDFIASYAYSVRMSWTLILQ
jgi:hypothetical protein